MINSELFYNDEIIEILGINLKFCKKEIHLILAYIPYPDKKSIKNYWDKLKKLLEFKGSTFIVGDFNVHYFNTSTNMPGSENYCYLKKFVDKLQPLYQLVKQNTRDQHILDLIFSVKLK